MNVAGIFFDRPWLLVLVPVLPALAVAMVLLWHRRRRVRLERLGQPSLVARLVPPAASRPPWPRALLLSLAALCGAIAFAGPRWGAERTMVRGSGIDIVLALDASLSMMATDERPNRLERMKQEVRRLRDESRGDRFALLAFAGRSYILTPLTVDDGALELFLDNLDPSVVGQAGSSLARAIRQGVDLLLSTKSESDRAIVVMSDGEGFESAEEVQAEARRAQENGISLVTVGFGTEQGATIPVRGEGNRMEQKRDESGNVVVSRYSPGLLQAAAQAANGTFVPAGETDKAGRVRQALAGLRTQTRSVQTGQDRSPRFQLFVIPALVLLLLDTLLAERRGRRRVLAAAATPAAAALLLALALPRTASAGAASVAVAARAPKLPELPFFKGPDAEAAAAIQRRDYARAIAIYRRRIQRGDTSAETLYNLGTALIAADSLTAAAEPLERAAQSRVAEVRFRALFNLGLTHLERGLAAQGDSARPALDAALATYKKALLMRPADGDAKWNYELALQKKKSGGGGGGGGGGGQQQPQPQPEPKQNQQQPAPKPAGGIGREQAEQLLNSAARDEKDVQGKRQKQSKTDVPPGGKDW
ncbi:MAG: VWA domain-containing protein [Gemmatimonadaceae bacterium]